MAEIERSLKKFTATILSANTADEYWQALRVLYADTVGVRLFTVMTVDLARSEARRAFTSHPAEYPVSGVKPIEFDDWFDIVSRQQRLFVANTIDDIAKVFPDHEKIRGMGCGSVVNVPVIVENKLVATINILDAENHYEATRVAIIEKRLIEPAYRTYLACVRLTQA